MKVQEKRRGAVNTNIDYGRGVTAAYMEDCTHEVLYAVNKRLAQHGLELNTWSENGAGRNLHKKLLMNKRYVAKAKCSGPDQFDAAVGCDIAQNRVLSKYKEAKANRVAYIINELYAAAEQLEMLYHDLMVQAYNHQESVVAVLETLNK